MKKLKNALPLLVQTFLNYFVHVTEIPLVVSCLTWNSKCPIAQFKDHSRCCVSLAAKDFPQYSMSLKQKTMSLSYITQFCLQKLNIYLPYIHKDYLVSAQQILNYKTSTFQKPRLLVCLYQDDKSTSSEHKYIISIAFPKIVLKLTTHWNFNPMIWFINFFYFLPALHLWLSILPALVTGLSDIQMCHIKTVLEQHSYKIKCKQFLWWSFMKGDYIFIEVHICREQHKRMILLTGFAQNLQSITSKAFKAADVLTQTFPVTP